MHELPVTENILEIALRHAGQADARRIIALHIVIGQLASIVDDSVKFYWDILTKNTIAAGSTLNFKRIPAVFQCLECKLDYSPSEEDFSCPACNSIRVNMIKGDEFYLEAIDIE